ncbi:MAG: hypothetical protein ACR2PL_14435 [Dehalococcoidia bacterium]
MIEDRADGLLITRQGSGELIQPEAVPQPLLIPELTPDQLPRRQELGQQILENRKRRVISPLTTVDLVHLSRNDAFWYGEEAPDTNGAGS